MNQRQDVALVDGFALLVVQAVLGAIRIFVLLELGAVFGLVERIAHLVQRISLHRRSSIEHVGARNWHFVMRYHAHPDTPPTRFDQSVQSTQRSQPAPRTL